MNCRLTLLPAALLLASAVGLPASAQGTSFFGPGGAAPAIRLKELGPAWRRVTIGGPEEFKRTGSFSSLAGGIFGAMFGGALPTSGYTPPSYTRGEVTAIGSEQFLVVYRPEFKGLDMAAMMRLGEGAKPPAPEKLTPETPLILTLVNLRSVTSLSDLRPFNLQTELAESAKAAAEEAKLLEQIQQRPPAGAFEDGVVVKPEKAPPAPARPAPKKPAPKGR